MPLLEVAVGHVVVGPTYEFVAEGDVDELLHDFAQVEVDDGAQLAFAKHGSYLYRQLTERGTHPEQHILVVAFRDADILIGAQEDGIANRFWRDVEQLDIAHGHRLVAVHQDEILQVEVVETVVFVH